VSPGPQRTGSFRHSIGPARVGRSDAGCMSSSYESSRQAPTQNTEAQGLLTGLFVITLFIAPAAIAAAILFRLTRRHLGHREGWMLAATGAVLLFANFGGAVADWLDWWLLVIFNAGGAGRASALTALPWLSTVGATALILGTALGLTGTRIAGKVQRFNPLHHDDLLSTPTLLPTDTEKQRVTVVSPPAGLTAKASDHTVLRPDDFGRRQIPLGLDAKGAPVHITEDELRMHAMIFGSTGSGKTETIKGLAGALMDLGWYGHILDLKEDTKPGGLRDFMSEYASFHAMPYQELRLSSQTPSHWFNPLANMGPDEVRDTILALQTFDDGYWQSINKQMLGQLVNLFHYAHEIDPDRFPTATMYDMGKVMSFGEGMGKEKAVRQMLATVLAANPTLTNDDFHTILRPSKDHATSAAGFGARLTAVYETQAGRYALRETPGAREYDITLPGVGYIGLDSQGKSDLSNVVATAFLQRTSVWAAQRTTGAFADRTQRFMIIDEASVLNRQVVHTILTKARSAGITIVLCSQSPLDFNTGQAEAAGFSALAQNANVMIFMAQGEPEAAEICADFIGKTEVLESNMRYQAGTMLDSGSVRRELKYLVEPDDLRRLGIGEAILRVGKPAERISWMAVKMRDPKTSAR
jgi:hypothetical protein